MNYNTKQKTYDSAVALIQNSIAAKLQLTANWISLPKRKPEKPIMDKKIS